MDSFGNPEYKEVPIFYQKYCHKHSSDGTAKCFSCGRLEVRIPKNLSIVDLNYDAPCLNVP